MNAAGISSLDVVEASLDAAIEVLERQRDHCLRADLVVRGLGGHRVSALVGMILDDGRDALDRLEAAAAELEFVRLLGTGDEDEGAPP